jgi:tRNA-splicing ligase RtcB
LPALYEARADNAGVGTWAYYDGGAELERLHLGGVLPARGVFAFGDWVRGSGAKDGRDAQIGSVGGGNHFVELQVVEELFDGYAAHEWGLGREQVTIMVHSGSVGLGHAVGGHFVEAARAIWPKTHRRPEHGFWPLPTSGPHQALADSYLDAMANAANFAFGNRMFLGLMAVRVLSEVLGRRVQTRLVYDAPHNLIWDRGGEVYLHRKGACPAPGPDEGTPFAYTGHPVIIPGSMGASSYVLAGCGTADALESACHGAGRVLSRGETHHVAIARHQAAVAPLRVVMPIDPRSPDVRLRRDILAKHDERIREEAPYAYKDVTAVVQTVEDAGIARRVGRLWPIMTVKG